ncbi:MAG: aldo/keto reductase [Armatimonadetes bacterium]|nr:aldo/keto reductase [Armatimonadota bacterium]
MTSPPTQLPTRRLGKTDIEVTIVGFGGIPIQLETDENAIAAVRRAYDLGVNFFDTARGYTTSEERIGKALEGRPYIVATKTGNREPDGAYQDVLRSLQNLRRDHIDLYQLHGVNDDEDLQKALAPGGALEALRRARDEGKIAHIGITGHRRETLVNAVNQCDDFATVQVPFNLVETEILNTLVPLCQERDVGTIAMKPVGGGNFTNAPLAVKWCLTQPITTAIPGMANVREVEEDVAVAGDITLTLDEQAEVDRMTSELDQRTCRRCRYCEPCPQGVQIGMLLHGRSIIRRMGPERWKEWGAIDVIASADLCIECGECLPKCPYHLPIPDLIREHVAYYRTISELTED